MTADPGAACRWARAGLMTLDGAQVPGWALETGDDPPEALAFVVPRSDGQFLVMRSARNGRAPPAHVVRSLDDALATGAALAGIEWGTGATGSTGASCD